MYHHEGAHSLEESHRKHKLNNFSPLDHTHLDQWRGKIHIYSKHWSLADGSNQMLSQCALIRLFNISLILKKLLSKVKNKKIVKVGSVVQRIKEIEVGLKKKGRFP